eukprot:jgi/Tetstr1/425726/TSEL_016146.t1
MLEPGDARRDQGTPASAARSQRRVEEVMDSLQESTPMRPWLWILVAILLAWLVVSGGNAWRHGSADEASATQLSQNLCVRTQQQQYFKHRTCEFQTSSQTAAEAVRLLLPSRMPSKAPRPPGAHPFMQRPCVVMAVVELKPLWRDRMQAAGLFDDCSVFVYPTPHSHSAAINLLHGVQNSYIKQWDPAHGSTLNQELATLNGVLLGDWGGIVMLQGTEPDAVLRGFAEGLASGHVDAMLWERNGRISHPRSLLHELDFFQGLGFAVYLVGTEQDEAGVAHPGPLLHLSDETYQDVFRAQG